MREIKFRAWGAGLTTKRMFSPEELGADQMALSVDGRGFVNVAPTLTGSVFYGDKMLPMQYTGLKDKNDLTEIYECDILGIDGLVRGNMYESPQIYQERTDLIIPSITSKDWCEAYQTAMARGCKHTERYANPNEFRKLD